MIYTIQCTCGAVTGYEFDAQSKTVECIGCRAEISTENGKPLGEPPTVEKEEIDLLSVE